MAQSPPAADTTQLTIDQATAWGVEQLGAVVSESAQREAGILLSKVLGCDQAQLISNPDMRLTKQEMTAFAASIARRSKHEPIAKIIEEKEFWSLAFKVTGDTLDPRPDSETIVETALGCIPSKDAEISILDLGTGSGCLLLSLLSELPNARGIGIDKSEEALKIARENATKLGLAHRATFKFGNWTNSVNETFDIVISNPPYIPTADIEKLDPAVRFDPTEALDGGEDGLDCYRQLALELPNIVKKQSVVVLEIGLDQENSVCQIFQQAGFRIWGRRADLAGHTRCLMLRLY